MNTPISFTPMQLIGAVLAICAGIVTIAKAIEWVAKAIKKAKQPNDDQNARLDAIEEKHKQYDAFFAADKKRLDIFEESTRITQRALLALLAHGIDGNAKEAMERSKDEITNHLIER